MRGAHARISPHRKHTLDMTHNKVGSSLTLILLALMPALSFNDSTAAGQPTIPVAKAPVAQPARSSMADASVTARMIEQLATQLSTQKHLPGLALAIVQNGKVISTQVIGVTDVSTGQPITRDTVFRLASLSKGFAATLSAQLIAEGAMSWDSPVINQLPAFKLRDYQGAKKVSVRDILSHRVGLSRNTFDRALENNEPYPLLAERLADAPMDCTPGDCYAYQNIAFSLIGDMVFAATGDFYSHQVEKRIFHPLGMYGSTFGREALESSASWARPHIRKRDGWVAVRPRENYYRVPPAAGVNASIHDMALWLIAQMGHRPDVLPQALLNATHAPQVNTPGEIRGSTTSWRRERLNNAYYALGWRVFDYSGHTMVFHGGAVQGYRSLIGFLPNEDIGMVVLWNSESAAPSGLLPSLMDRVLGLPAHDWLGIEVEEVHD